MRCLELFSGTGSIGNVFKKKNIEVISLDIENVFEPTILCDIMEWNYKSYPPNYFDIITASPVCSNWSLLKKSWIGRKSKSIRPDGGIVCVNDIENDINKYGKPMVDKMFEIIEYFKPKYYWIENPSASQMWKYVKDKYQHLGLFYNRFDYCKYSTYGYKKPTIFATNFKLKIEPKLCNGNCDNMIIIKNTGNKRIPYRILHKNQIGNSKINNKSISKYDKYRIPPELIEELLESIILFKKK